MFPRIPADTTAGTQAARIRTMQTRACGAQQGPLHEPGAETAEGLCTTTKKSAKEKPLKSERYRTKRIHQNRCLSVFHHSTREKGTDTILYDR